MIIISVSSFSDAMTEYWDWVIHKEERFFYLTVVEVKESMGVREGGASL